MHLNQQILEVHQDLKQCPYCLVWRTSKRALQDHLKECNILARKNTQDKLKVEPETTGVGR